MFRLHSHLSANLRRLSYPSLPKNENTGISVPENILPALAQWFFLRNASPHYTCPKITERFSCLRFETNTTNIRILLWGKDAKWRNIFDTISEFLFLNNSGDAFITALRRLIAVRKPCSYIIELILLMLLLTTVIRSPLRCFGEVTAGCPPEIVFLCFPDCISCPCLSCMDSVLCTGRRGISATRTTGSGVIRLSRLPLLYRSFFRIFDTITPPAINNIKMPNSTIPDSSIIVFSSIVLSFWFTLRNRFADSEPPFGRSIKSRVQLGISSHFVVQHGVFVPSVRLIIFRRRLCMLVNRYEFLTAARIRFYGCNNGWFLKSWLTNRHNRFMCGRFRHGCGLSRTRRIFLKKSKKDKGRNPVQSACYK